MVLLLAAPAFTIECISENVESLIGIAAADVCGATLAAIVYDGDAHAFERRLRAARLNAVNPCELRLRVRSGRRLTVECSVQRYDRDRFMLELEPIDTPIARPEYAAVQASIERLQAASDIDALLASAAHDMREISGFDRVLISRFDPDRQSDVVAEAFAAGLDARYLGRHCATDFVSKHILSGSSRNPLQLIPDTNYVPAQMVSRDRSVADAIDLSRATLCSMPSFATEHVRVMGSRAAFSISLVVHGRLWGAVTGQHSVPRGLGYAKRAMCELMGHMLAWQIAGRVDREERHRHARESTLQARIGAARWTTGDGAAAEPPAACAIERTQPPYGALVEAIPHMLWLVDAANQFEYVNERWIRYAGMTLEQLRAAGRVGIFHPADFVAAGLGRPLPPADFDCEVRLRRADGAYRWHALRCVPFRAAASAAGVWLFTATDIEAHKSSATASADGHEAAPAATEAKSRFLATMSHEIRTPMNGLIGMTELLLLTPLNDEQREYAEVIRDSGQSLLRVLNDILDYSKLESGRLDIETVAFDLPNQVGSVVELLRPGFISKGVQLTAHIGPETPPAVVGDPGRLRQILLNLAGNALKFTPAGGNVRIAVSRPAGPSSACVVRFGIEDSGIGMAPDMVQRLFTPFSQGDQSTTRPYGGTGLGLSISAELVALMGGELGVESTPGAGSQFWFRLPFALISGAANDGAAPARRQRSEPAGPRTERILLVEDNEINTFLAVKQLQRLGFRVTAVTNGRQAVDTVALERYDLVFMDCHMPEMDGFEATRTIRKLEGGTLPRLPIIAMTADARDEDHHNCLSAGMDDYLSKPTNLDRLKAVLDRWLPAPERRQVSRDPIGIGV